MSPRLLAHALPAVLALLALASGIAGLATGVPAALSFFWLVIGIVLCTMIPLSLRGSRAAWSLVVSIMVVETIGTFFGAASLAKALHINLVFALLQPIVLGVGVVGLVSIRREYQTD